MRIKVGCELSFELPQTTPMIVMLNVHFSRVSDLERPDHLIAKPSVFIDGYRDTFGNWCNRLVAPAGPFSLSTDTVIRDTGLPDPVDLGAVQHQIQNLPSETLLFLIGSRYCETDRLSDEAWRLFKHTPLGWPRVQAFATSFITTSSSATNIQAPPELLPRPMRRGAACVVITLISPSPFADA